MKTNLRSFYLHVYTIFSLIDVNNSRLQFEEA